MKKVGIWGTGITAELVYEKITKYEQDIAISCFCDSDCNKVGSAFFDLPVISPDEMINIWYAEGRIDGIVLGTGVMHHEEVYHTIGDMVGGECEDVLYIPDWIIEKKNVVGGVLQKFSIDSAQTVLDYFEYEVTGACNLNCRGCGHFSNISEGAASEYNLQNLDRDLKRMSELFDHVRVIHILGGEPLLSKNLASMVKLTRQYFKKSILRVVTNGLLVRSMSEELIEALVDNDVNLWISTYTPTLKIYDDITAFCKEKGIGIVGNVSRMNFTKRINLRGDSDKTKIFYECDWHRCPNLRDGRLYTCSYAAFSYRLKERYDIDIPTEQGIDLFDEKVTGKMINQILSEPIEFCKYCTVPVPVEWSNDYTKKCLEDWVVD